MDVGNFPPTIIKSPSVNLPSPANGPRIFRTTKESQLMTQVQGIPHIFWLLSLPYSQTFRSSKFYCQPFTATASTIIFGSWCAVYIIIHGLLNEDQLQKQLLLDTYHRAAQETLWHLLSRLATQLPIGHALALAIVQHSTQAVAVTSKQVPHLLHITMWMVRCCFHL